MNLPSTSRINGVLSRVSVIIPAFNDQTGVDVCLKALAEQSYALDALEVIVVDNGSAPPLTLAANYPFKVCWVRCETPGSYAARNAGVRAATGEVLGFIDADCWPDANWLRHGVAALRSAGDKFVIGGEVSIIEPRHRTAVALYQWGAGFGQESNIHDKGFAATANLWCTRAQFDVMGPFDERLLSGGDFEWCWRAAKGGIDVRYAGDVIVHTHARTDLRGAIRQARRVVAGRRMLRKLALSHLGDVVISQRRSLWQATAWILSNKNLGALDRLRVLGAAMLIRGAAAMEGWRLRLGATAERR